MMHRNFHINLCTACILFYNFIEIENSEVNYFCRLMDEKTNLAIENIY